ncbi:MAG: TolC family protein [Planctomycetes bacterium]|nr:TolC family protein [Planctomycetota bacterium]
MTRAIIPVIACLFALAGCGVPESAGFEDVEKLVGGRTTQRIHWNRGTAEDDEAAKTVADLFSRELSPESAVQIALLNNPELQAAYEDLGVAQADLVQAGLLKNPTIFGSVQFPRIHRAIADGAEAQAELAKRLKDAGNLSELAMSREVDQAETALKTWLKAEADAAEARERLTVLLGAWGPQALWTAPAKLPEIPAVEIAFDGLESLAISRRLDLAAALRERDASQSRLDLVRTFRWLGTVEVGLGVHREPERDVGWMYGPSLSLAIPIFDRQQAVIATLEAELRRREALNRDLAIRIRSDTRIARERLVSLRRMSDHQRTVVIPLRDRIVDLALKEYNFMLIGVGEVLRARQDAYDAYHESMRLARDYWIARTDLERAVGGKLPETTK